MHKANLALGTLYDRFVNVNLHSQQSHYQPKSKYLTQSLELFVLKQFLLILLQSFSNHEELQKEMIKRNPHKIDIGAVYNARPTDHRKISNFQPQEKELVLNNIVTILILDSMGVQYSNGRVA